MLSRTILWLCLLAFQCEGLQTNISSNIRSYDASNDGAIVMGVKGDTLDLRCAFTESGWAFVRWLQHKITNDSSEVVSGSVASEEVKNGTSLISVARLVNLTDDDAGNYSCIKTSLSGSEKFKFAVTIKDRKYCVKGSCAFQGQCIELINGFTCECNEGYIGKHCQIYDLCYDSPCHNGTCQMVDETFACTCNQGYGGTLCEEEVCASGVCGSGSCKVIEGKIECTCPNDRAGDRCQFQCSFSGVTRYRRYRHYGYHNQVSCNDKNTCKLRQDGQWESCSCDPSRNSYGNRCMMESDVRNECEDPNICNNAGSCYDHVFRYRCECYSYYSGKNCEFYDECQRSDNLCNTFGGYCVELVDGYKCSDCPSDQYGDKCQHKKDPCKVICYPQKMVAECDMRFLDRKLINNIPITLNSKACRFIKNEQTYSLHSSNYMRRRMDIQYKECGTEVEYRDDYIIYKNQLRAGSPSEVLYDFNPIITRKRGHFSFKLECMIPLLQNGYSNLTDYSLRLNETKDLTNVKDIEFGGTSIQFYDEHFKSEISQYIVGGSLYAKMTIDVKSNPTLSRGYELHPVSCFATPTNNTSDEERYVLLENGCILDDTFQFIDRAGSNKSESFFKFDSFSFRSGNGKLFLHCSSRICIKEKGEKMDSNCKPRCDADVQKEDTTTRLPLLTLTTSSFIASSEGKELQSEGKEVQPEAN